MDQLIWRAENGVFSAERSGFRYEVRESHVIGEGAFPSINGYWGCASPYLSIDEAKGRLEEHHAVVSKAIEEATKKARLVSFPELTAGTAEAIAYQLEVGRENHSCPVDDKAIAEWLRDLAQQLVPPPAPESEGM